MRALVGLLAAGAMAALAGVAAAQEPPFAAPGRALFRDGVPGQMACALCHTLKDAEASGAVGPDLNELSPDAARVEKAVRDGIGPMPPFKWLSAEQITLLGNYVAWAAAQR